jgi:hypothetical protein
MCGIIGVFYNSKKNKNVHHFSKSIFSSSTRRGSQSSGLVCYESNQNSVKIFKETNSFKNLYKNKDLIDSLKNISKGDCLIGHTRMETNGDYINNLNNQPVISDKSLLVHNGIICNHEEISKTNNYKLNTDLDSEIILKFIDENADKINVSELLNLIQNQFEGTINIIYFSKDSDYILVYSNNGSLFYYDNEEDGNIIVMSEEIFFHRNKKYFTNFDSQKIKQLSKQSPLIIDKRDMKILHEKIDFKLNNKLSEPNVFINKFKHNNIKTNLNIITNNLKFKNVNEIVSNLTRCKKCILPETFPFIEFNKDGICNYCENYKKINFQGKDKLISRIELHKNPKLLVTLSGGRDSCYGMHYIKKVLNYDIVSYSYDWGLVTDLARRNQARMCDKLGIEHILVSADINKKRRNVMMNVSAWLKSPKIGLIPLIIAGDKQYFEFANKISKETGVSDVILCENMLETTHFKTGYLGISPNFSNNHTFSLNNSSLFQMINNYVFEFIRNPSYINPSILDTIRAFIVYYFTPKDYINMFDYIEWDEKKIENTLINEYNWELSKSSKTTTWRIGDGTAAFYNYIYYLFGGFTEFDTFRSNQIREGVISREKAIRLVEKENVARESDFDWYCKTIGLDTKEVLFSINKMKTVLDNYK